MTDTYTYMNYVQRILYTGGSIPCTICILHMCMYTYMESSFYRCLHILTIVYCLMSGV